MSVPFTANVDVDDRSVTEWSADLSQATVEVLVTPNSRNGTLPASGTSTALSQTQLPVPGEQRSPGPSESMEECIWEARQSDRIDSIRTDTIANTDPSALSDLQRFAWYEFFRNEGSRELREACIDLWSEEITGDNAEKRNEEFRRCVSGIEQRLDEGGGPERLAEWQDILDLLERPYLALSDTDRVVLRLGLRTVHGDSDHHDCLSYYPQLYSGRWIPLPNR